MKNTKMVYLCATLLCSIFSNAQTDSETYNYYFKKHKEFTHTNSDSLIVYARKMQLSEDTCKKTLGIIGEAKGYYLKHDYDTAEQLSLSALDLLRNTKKMCDNKGLIDIYCGLFCVNKNKSKYNKALEYLLKRKEIIEGYSDDTEFYNRQRINLNLDQASLKISLGFYRDALKILKENDQNITTRQQTDSTQELPYNLLYRKARISNYIGDAFLHLYDDEKHTAYLDSTRLYYNKAYNITRSLPTKDSNDELRYQMRTVDLFIKEQNYNTALTLLNNYESKFKTHPQLRSNLYYHKAISYQYLQQYDSAIYFSKHYIKHDKRPNSYNKEFIYIYNVLANSYNVKKMNDSVWKYSNLSLNTIRHIEKNKRIISDRMRINELEKLKILNRSLKAQTKASNFYTYFTIISLMILIGVFFIKYKQETKKETGEIKPVRKRIDSKISDELLLKLEEFETTTMYLETDFNIKSLADFLETNTAYLSNVINTHKQKTFKHYLSELRINYLLRELKTNQKLLNYSIEAIAKEVGYTNASAFARVFKSYTGKTPFQYIKSLKK